MRNSIKLLLAGIAISICSQSYAMMENKTVSTTCYFLKNNQLISKTVCQNEHSEGYAGVSTPVVSDSYSIKGQKPITTSSYDDAILNGKKAINQQRLASNLKILSKNNKKVNGVLDCYKNPNNNFEICVPMDISNSERELGVLDDFKRWQ